VINVLKNILTFAGYGAMIIAYIYLMNWSLKWYLNFRWTSKERRNQFRTGIKPTYDWQEIVSLPLYFITWSPVILIGMAFIGGFFYFLYNLLMNMVNVLGG